MKVKIFSGGSHADVLSMDDKVLKLIDGKKNPFNEDVAKKWSEAVEVYEKKLRDLGVSVPHSLKVKITKNEETGYYLITHEQEFKGHNLEYFIKRSNAWKAIEDWIQKELESLRQIFAVHKDLEIPVGVDPKPANFTWDGEKCYFVDLFPPRYKDAKNIFVEYPEPRTAAGEEIAFFRHFDIRGVLTVLLGQLCRLQPKFRSQIKELIIDLSQKYGCSDYFANNATNFSDLSKEERLVCIHKLTPRDMYGFREIACELVAEREHYSQEDIDKFFHLSHFDDGLITEQVEVLKMMLIKMVHGLPLEVGTKR